MNNTLLYRIALTLVPNVGPVPMKILLEHFGDAEAIFKAKKKDLCAVENIGELKAKCIKDFDDFKKAEMEIAFIEKYKIEPLFITEKNYPQRLLHCYDAPTLLYYRGNADLNHSKIISIIGTRSNTDYGRQLTEKFIEEIKEHNAVIVSGLAFGIDAVAHKVALQNELQTVAIVAHGLNSIYPAQHKSLAKDISANGGLLTEFTQNTKPDKFNFPQRNRIVAGMADATIVVETPIKGGSMITAELANNYNKDVFAFPGKTTDTKSAGCNHLIKNNKAVLLTEAQQFIELMGWEEKKTKKKIQKELFIEFSENEKIIYDALKEKDALHIDEIYFKSALSSSTVAASILNLELQNIIVSLPGKMYKLI
jgi:DNA processing protein